MATIALRLPFKEIRYISPCFIVGQLYCPANQVPVFKLTEMGEAMIHILTIRAGSYNNGGNGGLHNA